MTDAPDPGMALGCGARIRLQPSNELRQVVCRKRASCGDQHRGLAEQRDRREIAPQIELERIDSAIGDEIIPVADDERVAIGSSTGHAAGANASVRTGHVLDNHGLTERPRQIFAQDSCDDIGRRAGRISDHTRDWPRGIGLRPHRSRHDGEGRSASRETERAPARGCDRSNLWNAAPHRI